MPFIRCESCLYCIKRSQSRFFCQRRAIDRGGSWTEINPRVAENGCGEGELRPGEDLCSICQLAIATRGTFCTECHDTHCLECLVSAEQER